MMRYMYVFFRKFGTERDKKKNKDNVTYIEIANFYQGKVVLSKVEIVLTAKYFPYRNKLWHVYKKKKDGFI